MEFSEVLHMKKEKLSFAIIVFLLIAFTLLFTTCLSTGTSVRGNRPTFTIVNNTGYTIHYVYISPRSNDSWGRDWLRSDQVLGNGQSISWYYSDTFPVGEVYDTRLVDSDGFTYTRENYRFTENGQLTFTINHADARYFQENFTPSFLWSTGANQQNSGIRTVSFTNARAEILRLFKLYNRFYFSWDSDNHYDTRVNYQNYINGQYNEYQRLNNPTQSFYYSWVRHWLNNNDKFAYAYISELFDLSGGRMNWYRAVRVNIIKGSEVISFSFINIDPSGHSNPTSDDNRRWLIENILDRFLN